MSDDIHMYSLCGSVCGDSALALELLDYNILPKILNQETVTLDFERVRVVNSSFSNALFGNLVKRKGVGSLCYIKIKNACPLVEQEIKAAIQYGAKKRNE